MANENMGAVKKARQNEMNAYLDNTPDVFRGKTTASLRGPISLSHVCRGQKGLQRPRSQGHHADDPRLQGD
jgi:hypothetical protein